MVSANREMVVYCFDTLLAHYNGEEAPPPAFDGGQQFWCLIASVVLLTDFDVVSGLVSIL
ncbi:AMMECR1-like protein [Cucumis melo var. makuwa]|uniref:AMMECR1-like protein n=1 Tax=Cucumis melo var. makuwa TaxID=1194695 RepID=A0A5D3D693_CUCMM|nr:AMMECR1-like protein [Cucumis melo var. makuwa]